MNKYALMEKVVDYADRVFFYCVKRCKNRIDAEDLSQTILLECIVNINKGTVIENMDYYIWGVCKNLYNQYLRKTIKEQNSIDLTDDVIVVSDETLVLDNIIADEKIALINQAIKLLSVDYSEILYAYYVEDKTLSFIAENLRLPLGTVKWKLSEIRKKLKEYLNMERLNGRKAYVPKNFNGVLACDNMNFDPYKVTESLLIKNLLYHSYGNPCSIEDYAIELGIARPYIEDYVERLLAYELLKKTEDNKYLTTFVFIDKHIRRDIYDFIRNNIKDYANAIIKFCNDNLDYYKSLIENNNIKDEHLMWSLLLITVCISETKHNKNFTLHNDGSKWDFCLMETIDKIYKDEFFISFNSNSMLNGLMCSFPSSYWEDRNEVSKIISYYRTSFSKETVFVVESLLQEKCLYSKLDDKEKSMVGVAIKENAVSIDDDIVVLNIPTLSSDNFEELKNKIKNDVSINNEIVKLFAGVTRKIKDLIPSYLDNQLQFIISSTCNFLRSLVLTIAYNKDLIKDDNENEKFVYNNIVVKN